jgi:hypothetical protein
LCGFYVCIIYTKDRVYYWKVCLSLIGLCCHVISVLFHTICYLLQITVQYSICCFYVWRGSYCVRKMKLSGLFYKFKYWPIDLRQCQRLIAWQYNCIIERYAFHWLACVVMWSVYYYCCYIQNKNQCCTNYDKTF